MAVERHLLANDYSYLFDANGDYVVVIAEVNQPLAARQAPLTTPKASLIGHDAYILAASNGATVIARSTGRDIFAHGGRTAIATPNAPLTNKKVPLVIG